MKKILFLLFLVNISTYSQTINSVSASSSIWSKQNAIDNNNNSVWSSNVRLYPWDSEHISISFSKSEKINYIKVFPRYINNIAYGFPKSFDIKYLSGTKWVTIRSENNFPRANRNDYLVLPFPRTVTTNAILFKANQLGKDNVGNNVFQLAEFKAGFERDFQDNFQYVNNNSLYKSNGTNEIRNVGSGEFNPSKLNIWHHDIRRPLMNHINSNNYYAPSIVKNGGTWNIYYGGFYNNETVDNIFLTTASNDFLRFSGNARVISNLHREHSNNASVLKISENNWKILYTTFPVNKTNKPFFGSSQNGLDWNFNYPVTMNGLTNWDTTNSDGGNVLYYDNEKYHMLFTDYETFDSVLGNTHNYTRAIHHATSLNAIDYEYKGIIQQEIDGVDNFLIPNDVKSFEYNNNQYYLMGSHANIDYVDLRLSKSINSFRLNDIESQKKMYSITKHKISTLGLIKDNNRLYGYLYASSTPATNLGDNKIYANWLQKKVIFQNSHIRWGDIEEAFGPDRIELFMNTQVETGKFYIYDSDGTTLLYTSPLVTMKSGDIWNYVSNNQLSSKSFVNNKSYDVSNEIKGKIYPNPTKNNLSIKLKETFYKVEIYNINGGLVSTIETTEDELNIENLNTGVYFLKVYSKNNIHNFKFIKE